MATSLKESLVYNVSLCEYCQRQSCKAFTGLSNRAKMVGGGRSLLPEILAENDPPPSKTLIFNQYSLVAPQR